MGRRPAGSLMTPERLHPRMILPGRAARVAGQDATVLCFLPRDPARELRARVRAYTHGDGQVVEIADPHRLRLVAGSLPRRWQRSSDRYWCVYLGRHHPLANSAGYQYEHRLIAFGLARSIHLRGLCHVPGKADPRQPGAVVC